MSRFFCEDRQEQIELAHKQQTIGTAPNITRSSPSHSRKAASPTMISHKTASSSTSCRVMLWRDRFGNDNRPGGLVPTRFIPLLRQGERVNNVVVVVVADIGSSPLPLVVVANLDCFDCDNTTIVRPLVGPIGSYYGQNHAGRWQRSNNKRGCPARDRPYGCCREEE
jgi:hypothetical protein